MARRSWYGRGRYRHVYMRGSYGDRARTIAAAALVVLYLLARFVFPGLGALFVGMQVPYLLLALLLFLAWPVGAMHDKRIAVAILGAFLLLLALHIV
ncbi:MAG TPA: hypothetical protein VKI99_13855 [Candidatus Dormibacteraeota bacterium]|nr:hypothetical protein [Candidatus Dormibacteraeota bacterium]